MNFSELLNFSQYNNLDTAIVVIFFVYGIVGLLRGFSNEVSVWLILCISGIFTAGIYKKLAKHLILSIQPEMFANAIAIIGVFFVSSIILQLFFMRLKKLTFWAGSFLDKSMGILFGFIKAFVFFAVITYFVDKTLPRSYNKPAFVNNSQIYKFLSNYKQEVEATTEIIQKTVKEVDKISDNGDDYLINVI